MPIYIPTIIKEVRENATEDQREGLSILENRFYECIELKKENAELVQKIHLLENQLLGKTEQLKDCIETIKFYAEMKHCSEAFDNQGCGRDYWINEIENGIYHLEGFYPIEVGQKAKEYLKKWGLR